jgi:hypothetical protein
MKHLVRLSVLAVLFCVVDAAAQPKGATDVKITYRDPESGQETSNAGKIVSETLDGVTFALKAGGKNVVIPALNVIDMDFELPDFTSKQNYRKVRNAEKEGDFATALTGYQAFTKTKYTDPALNRYFQYRIVLVHTEMARKDGKHLKDAAKQWADFKKSNANTWQIMHMPRLLLPLYFKNDDTNGARGLMEEMLALPTLPADMKLEFTRKSLELFLREKKYKEAEGKLLSLIKPLGPDDPARLKLELTLAECRALDGRTKDAEEALRAILDRAKTPETKAIAYNGLSELFIKAGDAKSLEQAKWNLLYIEMLYNQSREERARALYNLSKVFTLLKEPSKANRFRDLLINDADLAGEYQDTAKAEKQ